MWDCDSDRKKGMAQEKLMVNPSVPLVCIYNIGLGCRWWGVVQDVSLASFQTLIDSLNAAGLRHQNNSQPSHESQCCLFWSASQLYLMTDCPCMQLPLVKCMHTSAWMNYLMHPTHACQAPTWDVAPFTCQQWCMPYSPS